jgi:hypothetical protein
MQSKLTAFVVIATSFLMAATLLAQTPPTQPALPKAQVSVVMPTQTSTVNVAAGNAAALTSALAAATCGQTEYVNGVTWSGNVLAGVTLADYPTGTVVVYPYTGAWLPLL